MDFNLAEKLAIIKAMDEVILVDGHVDKKEIGFLNKILGILKFDRSLVEEAREINAREAMSILASMPTSKKHALKVILNETAFADGVISEEEVSLISRILIATGIE